MARRTRLSISCLLLPLSLGACSGSSPTTPTSTQAPPPQSTPPPSNNPTESSFSISLPIRASESAHNAFGLVPFGVHIGDHGVDGHPGWDIEYAPGASIYAAAAGTVQSVMTSDNGGNGTSIGIQVEHRAGSGSYRTIYGVGTLAPGITAGASVAAGQALGVVAVYTRTIGRTTVTYGFTHFQVDDFSSRNGLTNENAVSADKWLDASGRATLDAMWREASYAQELVEPFLDNSRNVSFPLTRVWTLQQGGLAARLEVVAASPYASSYSYVLRDASGAAIEQGTIEVEALAKPFPTIDLTPGGSNQPHRGVYAIFEHELRLDYGAIGASRPADLSGASTYRPRYMRRVFLLLLAAATVLAIWAVLVEPSTLRNETYELSIPRWPASCSGLRVAMLTDLHVGSPFNRIDKLDRIIELTRQARPQLILVGGDLVIQGVVGGRFTAPEDIAARLRSLNAPLGVWAVLGNHDWWLDAPRVQRALEASGIRVLDDSATAIRSGSCTFWLAGISDFWEGAHDVSKALSAAPPSESILAFTHNPDVFPDVPSRVSLTIAGHTHGGQVAIPVLGRLVVPSRYGQRYAIGHIVEEGRHLFVGSGLGTSILPVRFRVPPEVSILILRSTP